MRDHDEDGSTLPGSQILVVDDVFENRQVIERQLTRAGFAATGCADGASAIELVSIKPPHLILLDWMMPGLSGMETLRAIREHYDANALPVIMCTARDEESSIVAAIEAGANDYIQKPIKVPVLLARVTAQLIRRTAALAANALTVDLEIALARRTRDLLAQRISEGNLPASAAVAPGTTRYPSEDGGR